MPSLYRYYAPLLVAKLKSYQGIKCKTNLGEPSKSSLFFGKCAQLGCFGRDPENPRVLEGESIEPTEMVSPNNTFRTGMAESSITESGIYRAGNTGTCPQLAPILSSKTRAVERP